MNLFLPLSRSIIFGLPLHYVCSGGGGMGIERISGTLHQHIVSGDGCVESVGGLQSIKYVLGRFLHILHQFIMVFRDRCSQTALQSCSSGNGFWLYWSILLGCHPSHIPELHCASIGASNSMALDLPNSILFLLIFSPTFSFLLR